MSGPVYCAPAARPFRFLHVAEPGADFHPRAGMEPLTLCGLVMAWDELWIPFARQAADKVCRECSGEAGDRQAATHEELCLVR
jgi:hypothetical protein